MSNAYFNYDKAFRSAIRKGFGPEHELAKNLHRAMLKQGYMGSESGVRHIMKGRVLDPRVSTLWAIARVLDLKVDDLVSPGKSE